MRERNGQFACTLLEEDISDVDRLITRLRGMPKSSSEKGAYMALAFIYGMEAAEATKDAEARLQP